jgi:hypothetical protein
MTARPLEDLSGDRLAGLGAGPINPRTLEVGAVVSRSRTVWGGNMTSREFKVGEYVTYHPTTGRKADGRYVVIARFVQPNGKPRYIIRREYDPTVEYTAEAKELRAATSAV